jgi:serine O-acetyltransferase
MCSLKQTFSEIKRDLPGTRFSFKVFLINYLYSPRFRILLNFRLGKFFNSSSLYLFGFIGKHYKVRLLVKRGCDISYNASIGSNLRMPHPLGIVVGDQAVIKDNVTLFQHVTLGSHGNRNFKKQYPTIEAGVIIYAGAKIIGGINIGENAVIGANAVVNIDVPPGAIAVGIPCKIIIK